MYLRDDFETDQEARARWAVKWRKRDERRKADERREWWMFAGLVALLLVFSWWLNR